MPCERCTNTHTIETVHLFDDVQYVAHVRLTFYPFQGETKQQILLKMRFNVKH